MEENIEDNHNFLDIIIYINIPYLVLIIKKNKN